MRVAFRLLSHRIHVRDQESRWLYVFRCTFRQFAFHSVALVLRPRILIGDGHSLVLFVFPVHPSSIQPKKNFVILTFEFNSRVKPQDHCMVQ